METDTDRSRQQHLPCDHPTDPETHVFPDGLDMAYRFAVFNGLSSQIVLGSPMVLYAKSLGASSTVLGLITGMMPLLVMLQIPAAQHVLRVGYKQFMMAGWSARAFVVFGMALVPLSGGFLDNTTQLVLMLALLFLYNFLRGIVSGAWLPWVTGLIPVGLRGRYITREQWCVNLAGALSLGLVAILLVSRSSSWRFALVFLFSACMGLLSLVYLKRIPDIKVPPEEAKASGPVPWLELSRHAPFQKILQANVAWGIAYGGLQTFIVSFLRSQGGMTDGSVLLAMATFYIGGMASLWIAGSRMDRHGSKPVLKFTMLLLGAMCLCWALMAAGILPVNQPLAIILLLILGLGSTLFVAAQYRLAMITIPKMGRSHCFALFSVVLNLALGLSPLFWGLLLDLIGPWTALSFGFEWNRFSLFFASLVLAFAAVLRFTHRLEESKAAPIEDLLQDLLLDEPKRVLSRIRLGQ